MLLAAAAQDAEVVYHLLLASALVDKTELRLDMPPAVQSKFQRERSTLVKILSGFDCQVLTSTSKKIIQRVW